MGRALLLLGLATSLGLTSNGGCHRHGELAEKVHRITVPLARSTALEFESLVERPLAFPDSFGVKTLYLDAGHGAEKNEGNTSSYCELEQDFTRALGIDVANYLEATGHFHVLLSRTGTEKVAYADRLRVAERARVDAFVSLHSDVRGTGTPWSPTPGVTCLENLDSPGYVVLYSDEGPPKLVTRRLELARDVSRELDASGFLRYSSTYEHLYEPDSLDPSVLLDRHSPDKRIFILKKTTMPTVLIETHHALDPREVLLWDEMATRTAFANALARALIDFWK